MLIRVLSFLLESIFFVLIATALLRAWMNWTRVNMRGQPGVFVMAVTDWLVKPLRLALPKTVAQSKIDWASLLAALLFALAYALIWLVLFSMVLATWVRLPWHLPCCCRCWALPPRCCYVWRCKP